MIKYIIVRSCHIRLNIYFLLYIFYSFLWCIFKDIKTENLLWNYVNNGGSRWQLFKLLLSCDFCITHLHLHLHLNINIYFMSLCHNWPGNWFQVVDHLMFPWVVDIVSLRSTHVDCICQYVWCDSKSDYALVNHKGRRVN